MYLEICIERKDFSDEYDVFFNFLGWQLFICLFIYFLSCESFLEKGMYFFSIKFGFKANKSCHFFYKKILGKKSHSISQKKNY
jgi:hypothetical protein